MIGRWRELFADLGRAVLDLLEAEVDELGQELARSRRRLLLVVLAFALAAALLFWVSGLLVLLLVLMINERWPLWASVLAAAGVLTALATFVGVVGYLWLRRLESPVKTVLRRFNAHLDWWLAEVVDAEALPPVNGDTEAREERS